MIIKRTKNTIFGTLFGGIQRIIALIFPFTIRTIFIKTLGAEYLGLNSLFSSILQVLSLAELGVGSALVFSMYEPIANGNKGKICALMNLYKKYYRIIGLVVLVIGISVIPFLNFFIKGNIPADINIRLIYLMQLCSTVLTYWAFAYRTCLFEAYQRLDIVSIVAIFFNLLQYTLQILSLLLLKNYYVFLSISIARQLLANVCSAVVSKKMYPELSATGELCKSEVHQINMKVRDLFTAKLGSVVSNSFDTIVVSAFLGLTTLAIYQNYFYIVSAVSSLIMIFFTSTQAGIGNYLITNPLNDSKKLLLRINHIAFFVLNICCSCLITLYQPFMRIWVGEKYMLEYPIVIMFTIYLFSYILIRPVIVFKDAAGLWKQDRFRPLISSLVNLLLNLLTVKRFGLYGVLGSTIVSYLFISFPWVLMNINRHMFKINAKSFLLREIGYAAVISVSCILSFIICSGISMENTWGIIVIYFLISTVISCAVFMAFFYRTEENKYFMNKLKSVIKALLQCIHIQNKSKGNFIQRYNRYSFKGTSSDCIEGYEAIITRYYHTIEKGLSYENYRAGFGKNNIEFLISSMNNYILDGYSIETEFYRTALSVLDQYYRKNKDNGIDDTELRDRIAEFPGEKNELGGVVSFCKRTDTKTLNFEELMTTRHSIRHFGEESVSIDILKDAVQLAQYTPSACNRQGWRTRIVSNKDILSKVLSNQNGNAGFGHEIDKLLVVTSDLRYFNSDRETYQAFIDGGMYAESVINALYYLGVGSVPLSASLSNEQEKNVRKLLDINDAEVLILFIGVGAFPDENQTTRSERKKIEPIII